MIRWGWLVATGVLLLCLTAVIVAADVAKEVPVDEFDRAEIQRLYNISVKAQEMMERHIEMTARRLKLDVAGYNFDIERGVFVPKEASHEKDSGAPATGN